MAKIKYVPHVVTGGVLKISAGTIRLTKEQASSRTFALEEINRPQGIYRVTQPIEFKIGEVIGIDEGTLTKLARKYVTSKAALDDALKVALAKQAFAPTPKEKQPKVEEEADAAEEEDEEQFTPDDDDPTADGIFGK